MQKKGYVQVIWGAINFERALKIETNFIYIDEDIITRLHEFQDPLFHLQLGQQDALTNFRYINFFQTNLIRGDYLEALMRFQIPMTGVSEKHHISKLQEVAPQDRKA